MPIATNAELNRYSIAALDLEKALECATAAGHHPANSLEYEALLFEAIVSYARPFSANETSSDAEASPRVDSDFLLGLPSAEREVHQKCMILRNKALAHREWTLNPTRLRSGTGVAMTKPFSLLSPAFDLPAFVALAARLLGVCQHSRAEYVLGQRRGKARTNKRLRPTAADEITRRRG